MKILHVNTQDYGGAAKAGIRLHLGLLEQGADSNMLFLYQPRQAVPQSSFFRPEVTDPNYPTVFRRILYHLRSIAKSPALAKPRSVDAYIRRRPNGAEVFSRAVSGHDLSQQTAYQQADIVHLHWVAGLVDYPLLFADKSKKIVWTLHDQNPFTGGCHYDEGCGRFRADCALCPQLKDTDNPSFAQTALIIKQQALANNRNLAIVCPSSWLLAQSQQSLLFRGRPHYHIANGIDSEVFKPHDKRQARAALGLPPDKPILLFVADYIQSRRKGFDLMEAAHQQLADQAQAFTWVIVAKDSHLAPAHFHPLGSIESEAQMALAYSAADALIVPSREDNLPNTVVEALLCGLPVIGFPVGGIAGMIDHGRNGYLCTELDGGALASAISWFAANRGNFLPGPIRQGAVALYGLPQQTQQYLQLYRQLYRT